MSLLQTIDDYRRAAREVLPRMVHDYYRSGADAQWTLRANRQAYRRRTLWPRVLVDVGAVDLSTTLLGKKRPHPILVAPTAYHKLAHPDGEIATARGARAADALYILSMLSTTRIEDVAREAGPRWFQLYVHRDRGLTRELLDRTQASGYEALVVTVDTPILGRRLADERNGFSLPPGVSMVNLPTSLESTGGSALAAFAASHHDPRFTWAELEQVRAMTPLPMLVKGILRADDARRAVDLGVRGVIVSNHGGRQLDSSPATLDALPAIADAVGSRADVLVDGGIRWGTDVLKALALGARAVLVGRPVLWGLAVGGAEGVERVLGLLREELRRAMALAGCPSLAAVTPDLVS
jgi:4-hydroxymandelate oxidase